MAANAGRVRVQANAGRAGGLGLGALSEELKSFSGAVGLALGRTGLEAFARQAADAAKETGALAKVTASMGQAAVSTAKAFKKVLAGFDELTILDFGRGKSSGSSGSKGKGSSSKESGGAASGEQKEAESFWELLSSLSPLEAVLAALGATLTTAGIGELLLGLGKAASGAARLIKGSGAAGLLEKLGEMILYMKDGSLPLGEAMEAVFGKTAAGITGIATIVGGAVLAVTNFLAMLKDGFGWVREALMVLGIAIAAVGAVILGVPAAVAAVVAAIVAAVATVAVLVTEHWESVKAVFLGAWETVTTAWSGLAEWFNVNVIAPLAEYFAAVGQTISDVFQGCWILVQAVWQAASDWFRQNVAEPFVQALSPLVERAREIFQAMGEIVAQFCSSAGEWFNLHFAVPAKRAFQAVSDFVRSIFNGLIGMVEGMLNGIISRINFFLIGFSQAVRQAAEFLGVSWGGVSLLPSVSLPRLAQGAVIPPNRQFAAILGDQRSGTNIEAPLATIEQAVQNVLNRNGGAGKEINVTVESVLDGRVIARNTVRHINDMTQAAGRPVLVL